MTMPEHIEQLVAALSAEAQAVVQLLWHFHEEQMIQFRELREQAAERDAKLAALQAQNDKFKKMIFGPRSEKLPPISSEVRNVVEAEAFPLDLPASATSEEVAKAKANERRKRGRKVSTVARERRRKSLAKLPVIQQRVDVTADQLPDGMTLADFRPLGEPEVVRRIEHVREHLVIVEYCLHKYVSRHGETIIQAQAPLNVIDGGAWGASMYAHVIVSKCVDSMPLYRMERTLGRGGFAVARSVLCGLFHRAANVLEPLYARLVELVRLNPYVQADETKLRVAEPHDARNAWIWTLLCEDIVAYVYSESRAADTPNHLLAGTQGHLLTDGYSGYNGVVGDGKRTRVGCWAHARRKFFDALATAPEARELLDQIVSLYRVEHFAAERGVLGTEAHSVLRDERSLVIVDAIDAWVDERIPNTPPKSPLGIALTYAKNQRQALRAFLKDPKLPLDNNASERALRIIAIGRKNFLFVGHEEGGHNLAILQTLCSTCKLHDVDPYEYIRDVAVRV
ncbi:MAG TPA: IS66 family transposase, partial [Polyangiales bacterium]|nr:IS66 family transposase [Polyangiales bacterium]